MLLIKCNDLGGRPKIMTMNDDGTGPRRVVNIRIYDPEPAKGEFAGKLVASFQLSKSDAEELKRSL